MHDLAPYILSALGIVLFYGAKLIVSALGNLQGELKELRGELSAHHAASGERIKGLETQVAGIAEDLSDVDKRLRHVETIANRLSPN
jgi:hypothetical protein